MQCKVSFIFTYRNGFEQVCTFSCNQDELLSYNTLANNIHKNMMSDLGAIPKLQCNEGLVCVRLSEVVNLVVKGL